MDFNDQVPIGIRHILEADIPQNTSIINEDINSAKCLYCSIDNLLAVLNAVIIGNSSSAGRLDLLYYDIGGLLG